MKPEEVYVARWIDKRGNERSATYKKRKWAEKKIEERLGKGYRVHPEVEVFYSA